MSTKEAYQQKLQAKLNEWNAELDKLKAKADGASAEAKIEFAKQMEKLRTLQDSAAKKLGELKGAGDDAWDDVKQNAEKAWNSLEKGLDDLKAKMR